MTSYSLRQESKKLCTSMTNVKNPCEQHFDESAERS